MSDEHLLQQTVFEGLEFGDLISNRLDFGIHCGKGIGDFGLFVGVGNTYRQLYNF